MKGPSLLLLLSLFALPLQVLATNVDAPAANTDYEPTEDELRDLAEDAAEAFHDALQSGDVDALKGLVGGSFGLAQQMALDSQRYGDELRRLYRGSELSIAAVNVRANGEATVEGSLTSPAGQPAAIAWDLTLEYFAGGVRYIITGERTTSRL